MKKGLIGKFMSCFLHNLIMLLGLVGQAHPTLSEHERKRLCRVMDCQKLSMDACMHAAQNERLPLRVVVQVLFSEQVKISNALANTSLKESTTLGEAMGTYQPMIPNRKTLIDATPQSFQASKRRDSLNSDILFLCFL